MRTPPANYPYAAGTGPGDTNPAAKIRSADANWMVEQILASPPPLSTRHIPILARMQPGDATILYDWVRAPENAAAAAAMFVYTPPNDLVLFCDDEFAFVLVPQGLDDDDVPIAPLVPDELQPAKQFLLETAFELHLGPLELPGLAPTGFYKGQQYFFQTVQDPDGSFRSNIITGETQYPTAGHVELRQKGIAIVVGDEVTGAIGFGVGGAGQNNANATGMFTIILVGSPPHEVKIEGATIGDELEPVLTVPGTYVAVNGEGGPWVWHTRPVAAIAGDGAAALTDASTWPGTASLVAGSTDTCGEIELTGDDGLISAASIDIGFSTPIPADRLPVIVVQPSLGTGWAGGSVSAAPILSDGSVPPAIGFKVSLENVLLSAASSTFVSYHVLTRPAP